MPRPVLDLGTAEKIVHVTQASETLPVGEIDRQVYIHSRMLREELEKQGKHVRRIVRLFHNFDVKLLAFWEILGDKPGRKSQLAKAKRDIRNADRFQPKHKVKATL